MLKEYSDEIFEKTAYPDYIDYSDYTILADYNIVNVDQNDYNDLNNNKQESNFIDDKKNVDEYFNSGSDADDNDNDDLDSDYKVDDDDDFSDDSVGIDSDDEFFPKLLKKHKQNESEENECIKEENSFSSDSSNLNWSKIDIKPKIEEFTGKSGLKVDLSDNFDVEDFVKLFIGDDFFEYVTAESNLYRKQCNYEAKGKMKKWVDITPEELKKFFGLVILMGQVKKHAREEYWSTDSIISTPIFSETMSRNRFTQIWNFLHFSNNLTKNSEDRLHKITPIMEYFRNKFINTYYPVQELSLDETMMPWRGRLSFNVYNSSKIHKYGILFRVICEAESGYICNFKIYTGSSSDLAGTINTLVHPYIGVNHHLYMDNYYNSVKIVEDLLNKNIRVCGTLRQNRIPKELQNSDVKPGEIEFIRKGDTLILLFNNKRIVKMITNIHSAEIVDTRKIDRRTKKKIFKPKCIVDYNKYMSGVDRAGQYLVNCSLFRRTLKWYKKLFFYLLNCALFNSFAVYKKMVKNSLAYKKYLREVARIWINTNTNYYPRTTEMSQSSQTMQRTSQSKILKKRDNDLSRLSNDLSKHMIVKNIKFNQKKGGDYVHYRRCKVCFKHKKRSETSFICKECQVPLHVGDCFQAYHEKKNY